MHIVKNHFTAINLDRFCRWLVGNARFFIKQAKHPFHINKRLAQFTINPAKEIKRQIKLQKIGIHRNKIANGQIALLNIRTRHCHNRHQAKCNDGSLPDIDD